MKEGKIADKSCADFRLSSQEKRSEATDGSAKLIRERKYCQ